MNLSVKHPSLSKGKEVRPRKTMKWFDRLAAGKR